MSDLSAIFGTLVFNDAVMRERLPAPTYELLCQASRVGKRLDLEVANVVAKAMKDWAIEHGATHYTHWFQPLTGITAEKHDSFISPVDGGRILMEFSGKELIQGEPDASSFPSGGLRATFEARGYTAWDPTSYAFLKDGVLCIPTAFCSYGGEALDMKTPLLRSMEAINKQTMRILRLFGQTAVASVKTTVGPEQEYFLVDRELYERRPDLIYTGRTLFGAKPPKGQEMDDHYFGVIKPRVAAFMKELDEELWKLGILAKTEHNEAAPAQHELAPVFSTTNISTDHNQLTMEMMQKLAKKHDLVCLLHEKPFAGVNGSGKHNNWSLSTDTGVNLLNPGETPGENAQFLLFLSAVIRAVDEHQDLLRISVASAGNDHRLGAGEAPPAVVSMFLGDELNAILDSIKNDVPVGTREQELLKIGVHVLPRFPKDTTDRNRTSPFAFTGNKFEFRMLGSSASIADCNTVLNTAVAEVLRDFADTLEAAENFETALHDLIKETIRRHDRIIFNGNGYDGAWLQEAERRGLQNLPTTPDCLPHLLDAKNVALFAAHKVFSETELRSRCEIMQEKYCKVIQIEALTVIEMVRRDILPVSSRSAKTLADALLAKENLGVSTVYERETLKEISALTDALFKKVQLLEEAVQIPATIGDMTKRSFFYKDSVLPLMADMRKAGDRLETLIAAADWPFPTYGELLFGVR